MKRKRRTPRGQPHLIPLVFGDWSADGHKDTARLYLWSNKDAAAWRAAFARGCRRAKVALAEEVAADHEDCSIAANDLAALRASGFVPREALTSATGEVKITFDDFLAMFFHLVALGDPAITFTRVKNGVLRLEVHPGGYGLFGA